MQSLTLQPKTRISGTINLPGSKSLSNRILLLAALAKGETRVSHLLDSDDTRYMLEALALLGVDLHLTEQRTACTVQGLGHPFNAAHPVTMFLGNAGTAMRPLCAALAASHGDFTLTGEPRMSERPINDLVDTLRDLGANIVYTGPDGFPPLQIKGTSLAGGTTRIRGNISSQFLTALLMAAPLCRGDVDVGIEGDLVSKPYIQITLDVMSRFGVHVENHDFARFVVPGGQSYVSPGDMMVEGDASSASYFLAAAAIAGGTVRVNGVGSSSVQGDVRFAEVLEQMGAKVGWGDTWVEVSRGTLKGIDVDLNHIPDAAMTIATTALFAEGSTTIRNIYNWRVKETDRLSAMATELRKMGAVVEEGNDYIVIHPPAKVQSATIDTYNDHRMAMCFSLAAFGGSPIVINDPGCTAKTFPTYFDLFLGMTS